jgi:hypothetical protein
MACQMRALLELIIAEEAILPTETNMFARMARVAELLAQWK